MVALYPCKAESTTPRAVVSKTFFWEAFWSYTWSKTNECVNSKSYWSYAQIDRVGGTRMPNISYHGSPRVVLVNPEKIILNLDKQRKAWNWAEEGMKLDTIITYLIRSSSYAVTVYFFFISVTMGPVQSQLRLSESLKKALELRCETLCDLTACTSTN